MQVQYPDSGSDDPNGMDRDEDMDPDEDERIHSDPDDADPEDNYPVNQHPDSDNSDDGHMNDDLPDADMLIDEHVGENGHDRVEEDGIQDAGDNFDVAYQVGAQNGDDMQPDQRPRPRAVAMRLPGLPVRYLL